MREVDELILLDIEATNENRDPDYDEIRDFSRECFVPFCVGGGIHNIEQIRQLLRAGADKVAINTAAYSNIFAYYRRRWFVWLTMYSCKYRIAEK